METSDKDQSNEIPNDEQKRIWLICSESKQQVTSLMNNLIDMKITSQREAGLTITIQELEEKDDNAEFGPKENSKDGYWEVVKDWGECTKACGGGKQYKQLICVKPHEDSKDCEGENIRERDCNTFPCPTEAIPANKDVNTNIDFEKNEVKYLPISDKPLKYDKCVIMEKDAILLRNPDAQTIKQKTLKREQIEQEKIPVRLVMNLDTLTAYIDDQYKTPIKSVDIRVPDLKFENLNSNGKAKGQYCFSVSDGKSTLEACQLNCDNNEISFVDDWNFHINEFRQCEAKDETVETDIEFEKEVERLKDELKKKKMEEIRKVEIDKELANIKNTNNKFNVDINSYLQKEKKLQELIEKEEEAKGLEEYKELQIQMQEEQKKAGCLLKELQHKEQIDSIKSAKIEAQNKRNQITQKAQKQLNDIREASKKRIMELQKINTRRLKSLRDKIDLIRTELADKIRVKSYNGDINKCKIPTKDDENEVEIYCGSAFIEDPNKYVECRNYDTFCFVCCEHETNNMNDRENCYTNKCNPFSEQFDNIN